MGFYAFITILISLVFIVVNALLVPFAYLKICWHKIKLAYMKKIPIQELVIYILFGLIMGIF